MRDIRILVVDDDDDVRESVALLLRAEDYDVLTAGDGRDALALLAKIGRPSLVLLDWMMPGMDGRLVLDIIRADERFADIPIVLFTAASRSTPLPDLPVIHKPADINEIIRAIEANHP